MAFTKTRIWRGGVAGTKQAASASDDQAAPAAELEPTQPAFVPPGFSQDEAQALDQAVARVANEYAPLPGFAQHAHSPLSATRFMPIEQLFPGQHESAETSEPAGDSSAPPRGQARTRALSAFWTRLAARFKPLRLHTVRYETLPIPKRNKRGVIIAIAALLLVAGALLGLSAAEHQLSAAHATSTRAEAMSSAHARGHVAQREAAKPENAPRSESERSPSRYLSQLPAGLQKRAIDALVAGDLTRAKELYGQLAAHAGEDSVYHEALRILTRDATP